MSLALLAVAAAPGGWMTVFVLLALAACVTAILCGMGRCPPWVPILLLALYALLEQIPKGDS